MPAFTLIVGDISGLAIDRKATMVVRWAQRPSKALKVAREAEHFLELGHDVVLATNCANVIDALKLANVTRLGGFAVVQHDLDADYRRATRSWTADAEFWAAYDHETMRLSEILQVRGVWT